uniref:DUF4283 domain-containing protein n=1 Tax=Cannabis sativa TaxID=3483 RepID=A0A803QIL2_CANSA
MFWAPTSLANCKPAIIALCSTSFVGGSEFKLEGTLELKTLASVTLGGEGDSCVLRWHGFESMALTSVRQLVSNRAFSILEKPDTSMDDLLAKTNNLTVLDEEGWEINSAGGTEVASLCAMGRFCSNRPISRSLLKTILRRVWGIAEKDWGVEIKHTTKESSFLVFSFKSSQDLDRILTKNPWFLNNGLLIVERLEGIPLIWDKVLTRFPLSGRILQLPTRSITQGNLERLAGFAGEVIEVQKADVTKIVTKEFFTFKLWCDIFDPICPGFLFLSEGRKIWLPFRYDRLPFMCFKCGFVGHDTRGSSGRVQTATPPGFPVKRASQFDLLSINPEKITAGSSSSIDNPELLRRNMVNFVVNPTISGLESVNKGKAIDLTNPSCMLTVEKQVKKGNFNPGGRFGMEGMSERLCTAKRSGSWRDEGLNISNYEHNLSASLPNSFLQGSLIDTPLFDTGNLLDVPINYENSCDSLKKIEGQSKRRKVVPKRSKNKRGNSSNGALSMDSTMAGKKDDAKDISVVSDLTL